MRSRSSKSSKRQSGLLFLKGMAMGAADSVPGVSGGTIAFISGIYEELIQSIQKVNLSTLKQLFNEGPKAAWKTINGNFLVILMSGILVSIVLFASTVEYLLEHHFYMLMSFFMGLIIASCWFMQTSIKQWDFGSAVLLLLGTLVSIGLTFMPERSGDPSLLYIYFCGCIAICAMILPGISGAFILILLGVYAPVLEAVSELHWLTIIVFFAGCVTGLISFSNVLNFLFSSYKQQTISLLLGVLIGSLYTIWPWRSGISEVGSPENNFLVYALLSLLGFFLVYGLEKFALRKT